MKIFNEKIIVLLIICSQFTVVQSILPEQSLSKCLSFPIQPIDVMHKVAQSPTDGSRDRGATIFSDSSRTIKLIFADSIFFLAPVSGKMDSTFLTAGKDIIQCLISINEDAINWFCYYSFKMDSLLEKRSDHIGKAFSDIRINILIDDENHRISASFSK